MAEENKQQIESPNSVEFSVNAKLQWSGKVKVYAETVDMAYDKALIFAEKISDKIREKNGV